MKLNLLWLRAFYVSFYESKPSLTIAPKICENHRCQWSISGKTFKGDGPVAAKPLKNHRKQWCPRKNRYHPIILKKWPSLKSTKEYCCDIWLFLLNALHCIFSKCSQVQPKDCPWQHAQNAAFDSPIQHCCAFDSPMQCNIVVHLTELCYTL